MQQLVGECECVRKWESLCVLCLTIERSYFVHITITYVFQCLQRISVGPESLEDSSYMCDM